jgi:hypothetical protein
MVLADIPSAPNGGGASLFAVAGTAALVTQQIANVPSVAPQTIRIMDFQIQSSQRLLGNSVALLPCAQITGEA